MKLPFMNDQCEQMLKICSEFVRLQVSYEEYLCMKVLLLLSTGEAPPLVLLRPHTPPAKGAWLTTVGFNDIVFITLETMKCFGCQSEEHLV